MLDAVVNSSGQVIQMIYIYILHLFLVASLFLVAFLLLLVRHLLLEAMHLFLVAWHLLLYIPLEALCSYPHGRHPNIASLELPLRRAKQSRKSKESRPGRIDHVGSLNGVVG